VTGNAITRGIGEMLGVSMAGRTFRLGVAEQ
jgi:hypothetical protein